MAKTVPDDQQAYMLIDPVSGLTVVYSSEEAAKEDLEFFQSHLNNEGMTVMQVMYCYDRMPEDLRLGILTDLKTL